MPAETSVGANGTAAAGHFDRLGVELRRCSVGTLVGLLAMTAVLVGWRRLAGALNYPLETPALLLAGVLVAAMAGGARLLWRQVAAGPGALRTDWPLAVFLTAAVLGLGAALSLPDTDTGALIAFWALLALEEVWAWRPAVWRQLHRAGQPAPPTRPVRPDQPQSPSHRWPPKESPPAIPPDDVLQQLTRCQAADGKEHLSGWLRMPFSPGQRTASIHVAFCPPFAKTPELTVEQLDGPPLRIKTGQLLPHGARLDLKLAAKAEQPLNVLLQFSARTTA